MNNPYFLDWEITSKCNFNCKFCYINKEKDLSDEECSIIAKQLAKSDFFEIKIGGGEPLLRKHLVFKIGKLLSRTKNTVLVTNGYLIKEEDIDKIKSSFKKVQLSFHSAEDALFTSLNQVKSSFKKVLGNINLLIQNNVPVVINFVLTSLNFEALDAVYKFAQRKNLKIRVIRYRGNKFIPKGDIERLYKKFKNYKNISFDDGFNFWKKKKCGAIKNTLAISSSGDVYPCTWLRNKKFKLGNITCTPLNEIINSTKAKSILNKINKAISTHEEGCPIFIENFK